MKKILAIMLLAMPMLACAQTIKSIQPATVTQYQTAPTLVINGSGFRKNQPVTIGSTTVAGVVVNQFQVKAQVPQALVNVAGSYGVRVKYSNTVNLTVAPLYPQLTTVLPSQFQIDGSDRVLDIYGSNFVPGSYAVWTAAEYPCVTTYIDSTHLQMTVTFGMMKGLNGQYPVAVYNP